MKEQAKNTKTQPVHKTEVEKLKEEIQGLKDQLKRQPKSLEEKIKFYQEKQSLIKKHRLLTLHSENLLNVKEELTEQTQEDEFFSEQFSLKVTKKSGYSSESEILKIHNPTLINEVLDFSLDKINAKKKELQNLIND